MRYVVGTAILLLGTIAPALAQGPMSPVSLSNNTIESGEPAAPAATPQPSVALPPTPAPGLDAAAAAKPDAPVKKRVARKVAPKDDEATLDESKTAAADPASKRADKRRIDPDHMADMLNRMQLDGGYGTTTTVTITRISPSAGE